MENPILAKRKLVQDRIEKSFDSGINVPEEVEMEKAHQDGEIHPNGKWVWVSSAAGGKGDWRTRGGRIHNAHSENEKKFKQNFKNAQDGILQKIIDGKIQAGAHEKKWAQDILDERKKGSAGDKAAAKIIDLMKISNNKYSDISKVVAFKTDKGNWAMDYDGANTGLIIGKDHLSEAELKAAGVKIEGANANKKTDDTTTFVPKQYFKNAEEMANKMNIFLQEKVGIQKFVNILGKTVNDKGDGTKYRCINAGSGHYSEWDNNTLSYLQADGSGDYLEFKEKPSREKLNKCAEILKNDLANAGYNVKPKFYILDHNSYYQTLGTYGVGISIKVTKEDWKNSVLKEVKSGKSKKSDPKQDKAAQAAGFKDYEEMKGWKDYTTAKNLLKKPSMKLKSKEAYRKELEKQVADYEKDHADVIAARGGKKKTESYASMDIKDAKKALVGKVVTLSDYWPDGRGGSQDAIGEIKNVRLYGKNKTPIAEVTYPNGDEQMIRLDEIDDGKMKDSYKTPVTIGDDKKKLDAIKNKIASTK